MALAPQRTEEERVLRILKMVLTRVAKETAVPPGTAHPLSRDTIEELRRCFALIADREKELGEAAGRPMTARPRFIDEPRRRAENVIRFHRSPPGKRGSESD